MMTTTTMQTGAKRLLACEISVPIVTVIDPYRGCIDSEAHSVASIVDTHIGD